MDKIMKDSGEEINLLTYWSVLVRRKKLIGLIVAVAFVCSVIISLILPKKYDVTVSLMPPNSSNNAMSAAASLMSGAAGALLGSSAGSLGLNATSPTDIWMGVLKSNAVRDAIIERFDLKKKFGMPAIEDARLILDNMVKIDKSKEEIVSITVEGRDPVETARIAKAFIEELDRVTKNLSMSEGRKTRVFVEKRLSETKAELARLEEAFKRFQKENGAVKIDEQSKAIVEAIGAVKGQLMAKEVELQTVLSYATPANPQVQLLKTEVEELKVKLRELEEGQDGSRNNGIFIPTKRFPDISLQYVRLVRDIKVQQTLFELLTQQYEMASIQEAKDTSTAQVLDDAKVPEKKAKPKRAMIVAISTFTSLLLAVFVAFFLQYLEDLKTEK
jgi:uncharacterized protein involved in exopolysaccharide biosynthesis